MGSVCVYPVNFCIAYINLFMNVIHQKEEIKIKISYPPTIERDSYKQKFKS